MPSNNRKGLVFANGILAGELDELTVGFNTTTYSFQYDKAYINASQPPIGYHFPLTKNPYTSDTLHPFFQNLVSEGWVRVFQATKARLDKRDDFGLLLANGADLIGAITVLPTEEEYV